MPRAAAIADERIAPLEPCAIVAHAGIRHPAGDASSQLNGIASALQPTTRAATQTWLTFCTACRPPFMSQTKTRDSQLRVIPKLPRQEELGEATAVDVKRVAPRREQPLPSLTGRTAKGSSPPPNVIPFTKPRAISEIAAANPLAIIMTPAKPAAAQAKSLEPASRNAPVTSKRTGWTPPSAVKAVAPPATPAKAAAPVTAYPVATPKSAVPLPMQQPLAPPVAPPVFEDEEKTIAVPPKHADESPWAVYEQLGLGAPAEKPATSRSQKLGKWIVNAYRMLGFAILTIIVVVLIGYIATQSFFYVSKSWVVPMAISATDEKVVSLQAQLAEQQNARDRIADELNQAERAIAAQQRFQGEFAKAIKSDLDGRKAALGRVRALANAAAATRASIKAQNSAYASASRRKMAEEYAAGLIDRGAMLSGKFQLAQITSSNLSLAERQAEFETRASELEAQTRSLDAMLTEHGEQPTDETVAYSYEVLRIKQEYEASKLDLAKSVEARDTLQVALERQDKIVKGLQGSAYLRALADGANVAFIPYANLANVRKGTSLYACKVGMVFCYHVGEVTEVLQGEVQFKHPQRDKMLRGQMIELKLDAEDHDAASDDVLFLGGKPLLL